MGWLGLMTVMIQNVLKIQQKPTTFLLSSSHLLHQSCLENFSPGSRPILFRRVHDLQCHHRTVARAGRNDWISLAGLDNKVSLLSLKNRFQARRGFQTILDQTYFSLVTVLSQIINILSVVLLWRQTLTPTIMQYLAVLRAIRIKLYDNLNVEFS